MSEGAHARLLGKCNGEVGAVFERPLGPTSNHSLRLRDSMELTNVGEIVASRKIDLVTDEGTIDVTVLLGKPRPYPDSSGFFCPLQIVGVGDEKVRYAGGFDEVQSLQLALKMVGVLLETLEPETRARLQWNGSGDLGFQVS
jgi:Domain of unknown function (DUF6968)